MKHILTSFAATTMLALLAATGFAAESTLNKPVPGADQDPGYKKVTTPALSQNFVQRIAEKKQQAEREGKEIKLVLVGDSITHFWEGGGFGGGFGGFGGFGGGFSGFGGFGGGQGGQRPAGAAQGQGGQNAQSQNSWSELAKYHPLNLGFSGDRTENILHVVKNEGIFELIDPQLVTVMIGTNNFGMHESEPAATAEAIRLIVLAIKEKAPNAKILLYGIFPRGDGLGDKCAATNAIIKDFADNETVFYEDLTPKFTDEQGNLIQGVMNFDRLHPAEPGYKIWGESIKAFFDKHISGGAADGAAAKSTLDTPVPGAQQDFGYQLVTTPELSRNYVQRIQEKSAQADKEGKDIKFVMVGDSITHFWEQAGREVMEKNFAQYHPLDLGFAGDRTQNCLYVIDKTDIFSKIDPKLVMLLIGVNNFGWNQGGPVATAEGIRLCVNAIKAKAPNAKILLLGIFPAGQTANDQNRPKIARTNEIIKGFADNQTVFYEDLGPKFLTPAGNIERDIMADFLHPTAKGYEIWAEAIKPYVEKYCK